MRLQMDDIKVIGLPKKPSDSQIGAFSNLLAQIARTARWRKIAL